MKTISEALSYVQRHLKAPKNQHNKFGGYKYRSCEDILMGLKEVMPEGATVTLSDDVVAVGDRYYVVAIAAFRFGQDEIKVKGWAREALSQKGMSEAQCSGASSSYARKYALNGLFSIDDTKDADTNEHHRQTSQPKTDAFKKEANAIVQAFTAEDWPKAEEALKKLDSDGKRAVWGSLHKGVQDWIKENTSEKK